MFARQNLKLLGIVAFSLVVFLFLISSSVTAAGSTNLALGRPVTEDADVGHAFYYTPEHVVDGRTNDVFGTNTDYWLAETSPSWVVIDLVNLQVEITEIRWLNSGNGVVGDRSTSNWHVQVSMDTSNYVTVAAGIAEKGKHWYTNVFGAVTGRYVRFWTDSHYGFSPAVNEIEVYGSVLVSNAQPVADAGGPYMGATATLDGSGSSDADADPITYNWQILSSNLALGATCTVSSTYSASWPKENITDGNAGSQNYHWLANGAPAWARIDLGQPRYVSLIKWWNSWVNLGNYTKNYEIYVSADGVTSNLVATGTGPTPGISTDTRLTAERFGVVRVRYIEFKLLTSSGFPGLAEVEAYEEVTATGVCPVVAFHNFGFTNSVTLVVNDGHIDSLPSYTTIFVPPRPVGTVFVVR